MPFTPEQHREYRRKLKAEGICTLCHGNKAEADKSLCLECKVKLDVARKKYRKEKRCLDCVCKITSGSRCARCQEMTNTRNRGKYKERKERGVCTQCGVDSDGYILCANCHERDSENRKLLRSL